MVVLEAPAIGAASYGLYKGGEAGVKKGTECKKEFQREKKRSSQRSSLFQKSKTRSGRIAEIVNMKKNGGVSSANTSSMFRAGAPTVNSSGNGSAGITSSNSTNSTASFAARRRTLNEESSDIDYRHRTVMKKLASSRHENEKKETKINKLKSFNPFKKK